MDIVGGFNPGAADAAAGCGMNGPCRAGQVILTPVVPGDPGPEAWEASVAMC